MLLFWNFLIHLVEDYYLKRMRQWLSCVVVLHFLQSLVQSQAPGDGDPFCTQLSVAVTPPAYPPNARILMDSFHYLQLLSPVPIPSAWQQVDADDIISSSGSVTEWIQYTSTPCRQNLFSCYFRTPVQNNWLITQFISRNPNGTLLPQVNVLVEYQLSGCNATCQVFFDVNVWETSGVHAVAARDTANYRRVRGVTPSMDATRMPVNESIEVTFQSSTATGLYLALVDMNTCIAVTRVLVFYHVCPELSMDLILYPETISPSSGLKTVTTQCAEGAEGELNPSITLSCLPKGIWAEVLSGTGCRCRPGFLQPRGLEECRNCMAGEYVSLVNYSCLLCPDNTVSSNVGVAICECLPGYFRAPNESADIGCTPLLQPANETTQGGLHAVSSGALAGIIAAVVVAVLALLGCVCVLVLCCYKRRLLWKKQSEISRPTYNPNSTLTDKLSNSTYQLNAGADMLSSLEGNRSAVESESSLTNNLSLLHNLPKYLIVDPSNIEVGKVIGQGEFGLVYKGHMISKGGQEVAIKTLKGIFATASDVKSLSEEINKMIQFDHPNVMSLIGVVVVPSTGGSGSGNGPCMVMPFMARGSLLDQLRAHSEEITETDASNKQVVKDLNKMCLQIAKGMEYLAILKFVHRDLAARNCLVAVNGVIKVSDFGLAEDIYSQNYFKQTSGGTKLPLKWMSIESITQGRFTEKTDVWSYGVTCWEIFTGGNIPYPGIHPHEVLEYLESGQRLKKPKNAACELNVFSMMESCWKQKDYSRPTFSDIVSILERHLEFTAEYLDLSAPASQGETEEIGTSQVISQEYGSLPKIPSSPNAYYKS